MPVLEDILGGRVNIAILRLLTAVRGGLSGNEIAVRLGLQQSSARQALERLVQTGVVTRTDIGRSSGYELDRGLVLSKSMLMPLFAAEARLRRNVIGELSEGCTKLAPRPEAVILFGSLAQGGRRYRDADLLCVVRSAKDKTALHEAIGGAFTRLHRRYGLPVSATVVTEVQLRSSKVTSLKREVERDGILLYGTTPAALKGIKT